MPFSKVEVAENEDNDEKYAANDNSCHGSSVEGSFGITAHRSLRHGLGHYFRIANATEGVIWMLLGAQFICVFIGKYQGETTVL